MQISADFLALTAEAAILAKRGRIAFANTAAQSVLGADCVGAKLSDVFGSELSEAQASAFVIGLTLNKQEYVCRVSKADGVTAVFFFAGETATAALNDAFIYSQRNCLMSYGIAADIAKAHAEEKGDLKLLEILSSMSQSYFRLRRTVSNLAVLRGSDTGKLFVNRQSFDLQRLTEKTADTVNTLLGKGMISVIEGKPLTVYADPGAAEQLLLNLISNCLVHAKGLTGIRIALTETKNSAIIAVSDNGCGIAPEQLPTVFDRYRHGFDTNNLAGGAGIGLPVVRAIAVNHGGTLLLESKPGRGTTVRASLAKVSSGLSLGSAIVEPWQLNMSTILVGLADCLPADCFSEKYTD